MRGQLLKAEPNTRHRFHTAVVRDRWIVGALGVGGLVLGLPYALSAGFVYDDWYLVSHQILGAPSTGAYVGLSSELALAVQGVLFRADAHLYYVAAAVVFSLVAVALYVALRALHLGQVAALMASVFLLSFPAADSLRLWDSANLTLALAALLAMLGIAAGSRWVENHGRARLWLAASLLLWAGAIFCYFSVVVLMLLPVALIPLAFDRRRALLSFAMNLLVGVVCLAIILPSSLTAQYQANWTLSAYPGRALALWIAGFQFLVVGPFGRFTLGALALGLIAACLAAFSHIILGRIGPPSRRLRTHVGRELTTAALLVIGTLAAWTPLIPANSYYTPSTLGVGNRVNGFAQIFLLTAVAVVVTTVAELAGRLLRQPVVATATAAGLALVLLASSLPQTLAHAQGYSQAASIRTGILTLVAKLVPAPSGGTTVLIGDYNAYDTADWIPVFASTYDFNGALQILYEDPTLFGYPVLPGFSCTPTGLGGLPNARSTVSYDRLIVIDVGRRRSVDLANRATCKALLPTLLVRLYPS
jgi:hypothetical protein